MNKKYTVLFIAILCIGLLCAGGTYAYWSWNSSNNKIVGFNTVAGVEQFIDYNSGYSHFIGDFKPAANYCGGASNTISFKKTVDNVDLVATINMQVNEIEANTKTSTAVYWVVTSGTTTDCTGVLSDALSYGTFTNKSNGDTIKMLDNISVTTTEQLYTVWIWINSSGSNLSSLSGETINTNIWTQFEMLDVSDEIELVNYYIEYNANGGSGEPSIQTKVEGENINISSIIPTRDGYIFLGWSTSSNATSVDYVPGTSYSTDSDITLYAVWQLEDTHFCVFESGTGFASGYSIGNLSYNTTSIYNSNFKVNAKSTVYFYINNPIDVTNYKYIKVSGITFKNIQVSSGYHTFSLGLSSNTSSIGNQIYQVYNNSGDDGVYLANNASFTKDINDVIGNVYFVASVNNAPEYAANHSIEIKNICFYTNLSYTVTFDANGGSGAPSSQTKDYSSALTLSSTIPTRDGYTFLGWSTSSNATSVDYDPGDSYSINSDVTLYAVWQPAGDFCLFESGVGFSTGYSIENIGYTTEKISGRITVSGESTTVVYTAKPVDVTNYKYIKVSGITFKNIQVPSGWHVFTLGLTSSGGTMTNIYEVSNNSGDDGVYLAQNASVTYDISSLSGQMFFKGAVSNSSEYGASHEMEIKNICFTNSSS